MGRHAQKKNPNDQRTYEKEREREREREREKQRHRQREKQSPCREPDMGLGSHPGPKVALNRT
ncbi:unnamed protein product [Nyctereutes procyonoides]|uniref:(raccoon dog) hypothetical protein n=1 Tax=Nyctereutes procyonoides TaxID=34880 RepID=A0A811ZX38_NYCPR|nr:unnamed protein product [Nyctereutes procyonoides]